MSILRDDQFIRFLYALPPGAARTDARYQCWLEDGYPETISEGRLVIYDHVGYSGMSLAQYFAANPRMREGGR